MIAKLPKGLYIRKFTMLKSRKIHFRRPLRMTVEKLEAFSTDFGR